MEARRRFIAALGAAALATPLRAFAQQTPGKIPRLGVLLFNSPQIDPFAPLIEGLQALGYVDGKTVKIEYRYADGKSERLPALAAELVQLKPDLIFAMAATSRRTPSKPRIRFRSSRWSATIRCRAGWWRAWDDPAAT
jgi:ABC-type uncharacterized transport system substrate-binding protein